MKNFVQRTLTCVLPPRGKHRADTAPAETFAGQVPCALPGGVSSLCPVAPGEADVPLVRPFLGGQEQQREDQRDRRTALASAPEGIGHQAVSV